MRKALLVFAIVGVICWLLPGEDREPLKPAYEETKAKAKVTFNRQVLELCSMPRLRVTVNSGDGPTSLMLVGMPSEKYSEAVLVAAFEKINPGARLWVNDKVFAPDYPEYLIRQCKTEKLAKK